MVEYKDPWADAANQAVGALYKYYLSKPSAADLQAAELDRRYKESQIARMGIQNQTDQRAYEAGGFTLPNLSPEIRNDMYRRHIEQREGANSDAARLFGAYVNKPIQVDAGDSKYIADGSTGLPIQQYGVGIAPQTIADKEGGRLITTQAIPSTIRPPMGGQVVGNAGRMIVANAATARGVNPYLTDGMFKTESSYGQNQGPSSAGATGPMQVMPGTARDPGFGVDPAKDGSQQENVRLGVDYIAAMMNRYKGDETLALMAYNWGPGNVDNWLQNGADPNAVPAETRNYVQKILSADVSGHMGGAPQAQPQQRQAAFMQPQGMQGMQGQPQFLPPVGPSLVAGNAPQVQPDGTVVTALPKSPVAQAKEDERNRLKGISADLVNDEVRRSLDKLNSQGGAVTGMVGSMTSGIPGMPAHDFAQMLDTIKANIGFDKLQSMRDASPTGGALGQVSEFENRLLQAVFGSLQQSQTQGQLKYNLMRLQNTYNDIIHGKGGGPERFAIPTPENIAAFNSPEQLQGALEFFEYDPPQDVKNAVIQRANQLGIQ